MLVYILYIVYIYSMSKGISKKQLALAIAKGKRVELVIVKGLLFSGRDVDIIVDRIKALDREILEIDNYVPVAVEGKGLIQ